MKTDAEFLQKGKAFPLPSLSLCRWGNEVQVNAEGQTDQRPVLHLRVLTCEQSNKLTCDRYFQLFYGHEKQKSL